MLPARGWRALEPGLGLARRLPPPLSALSRLPLPRAIPHARAMASQAKPPGARSSGAAAASNPAAKLAASLAAAAGRAQGGLTARTAGPAAATATTVPPVQYAPPTPHQMLQLHARLAHPYVPSAHRGRVGRGVGECRVLSLDVGDRFVGVALSDGGSASGGASGGSSDAMMRGTGNRRAVPLTTLQRKELVAVPGAGGEPLSPHSHHARRQPRSHTELRGPASSSRRQLRVRPISAVAAEIRTLLQQHRCVGLVVGMPLTMSHQLDEQCRKTLEFVQQVQQELAKPAKPQSQPQPQPHAAGGKPPAPKPLPPFQPPALFFWDERLSSADARHQLEHGAGLKAHSRAMALHTDPMAAAVILQEFLDRMHLLHAEARAKGPEGGAT